MESKENLTHKTDIAAIEKIIGYCFSDKTLLLTAFTHSSFANENKQAEDYERLEYLGDAILDFTVALRLFKLFPSAKEGVLTKKRAALVSVETLSEIIDEYDLIKYMRVGVGSVASAVEHSVNVKCDLFEAITGAVYLDCGNDISVVEKFIWDKLEKYIDRPTVDYKSKTIEFCAKTLESPSAKIPPPYSSAEFPDIVLLENVAEPPAKTPIPPP